MRPVLVDSNVLLDVATEDPLWFPWSSRMIEICRDEAILITNAIVFAEVSVDYPRSPM